MRKLSLFRKPKHALLRRSPYQRCPPTDRRPATGLDDTERRSLRQGLQGTSAATDTPSSNARRADVRRELPVLAIAVLAPMVEAPMLPSQRGCLSRSRPSPPLLVDLRPKALAELKDTANALAKLTDIPLPTCCRNATTGETHKLLLQPSVAWVVALLALANTVNTASRISELQHHQSSLRSLSASIFTLNISMNRLVKSRRRSRAKSPAMMWASD